MIHASVFFVSTGFLSIFNIEDLIRYGGLLLVCLVVYANTGLFFCFFLPSGAVLFAAGVFAATGELHSNIFLICILLIASSVLGNLTGYWFGHKTGPSLYRRKDSRFFRRQYLVKTEEFYDKRGRLALIAAFFLPIIRTFSPIVAGIIGLKLQRFITTMVVGSTAWILSFVFAGYILGSRPWLKPWLKYIVIAVILFITIPLAVRIIKEFRKPGKEKG
ncbi:MAG: DedA family protein [Chitinophagales bacterium]